jgi:hypothetical protein
MVLIGLIIIANVAHGAPGARDAGDPVEAAGAQCQRQGPTGQRPDTGAVTS